MSCNHAQDCVVDADFRCECAQMGELHFRWFNAKITAQDLELCLKVIFGRGELRAVRADVVVHNDFPF